MKTETSAPCCVCSRIKVTTYKDAPAGACAQLTNPLCGEGDWDRFLPKEPLVKPQCPRCGSFDIDLVQAFEVIRTWKLHNNRKTKFSDFRYEEDSGTELGPSVEALCRKCLHTWRIQESIYSLVEAE